MPSTVVLDEREARLALLALMAVSPSGGGSAFYTLARKIAAEVSPWPTEEEVVAVQIRVSQDLDAALFETPIVALPSSIEGRA